MINLTQELENGKVSLIMEPGALELEAQTIRRLAWELEDLKQQEVICIIIAPDGQYLEITNQNYRRGMIRKFMREHRND